MIHLNQILFKCYKNLGICYIQGAPSREIRDLSPGWVGTSDVQIGQAQGSPYKEGWPNSDVGSCVHR